MECLFCDKTFTISPIEHIVSESLGNTDYTLTNVVCKECNNRFSKFEQKATNNTHLAFIRVKNGIKSKKGNPSFMKINNVEATGNKNFKKDVINIKGVQEKNITNYNPVTGSYDITLPDFDRAEMATSKMLLKIGFEAIFKSQNNLLKKYDFSELRKHLISKESIDWPFITSHNRFYKFKSIPTFSDKYKLGKLKMLLGYFELSDQCLLFDFQYDYLNLTINLLNRTIDWVDIYRRNDTSTSIYPTRLVSKFKE